MQAIPPRDPLPARAKRVQNPGAVAAPASRQTSAQAKKDQKKRKQLEQKIARLDEEKKRMLAQMQITQEHDERIEAEAAISHLSQVCYDEFLDQDQESFSVDENEKSLCDDDEEAIEDLKIVELAKKEKKKKPAQGDTRQLIENMRAEMRVENGLSVATATTKASDQTPNPRPSHLVGLVNNWPSSISTLVPPKTVNDSLSSGSTGGLYETDFVDQNAWYETGLTSNWSNTAIQVQDYKHSDNGGIIVLDTAPQTPVPSKFGQKLSNRHSTTIKHEDNYTSSSSSFTSAVDRCTELRSRFGSAAIKIVKSFFDDPKYKNNPVQIIQYVQWALRPDGPMLYRIPGSEKQVKNMDGELVSTTLPKDCFESKFIIDLVTPQLKCIKSSCGIGTFGEPLTAFALAAAALERAFNCYENGEFKEPSSTFGSERIKNTFADYLYTCGMFSERRWRALKDACGLAAKEDFIHETPMVSSLRGRRRTIYIPSSPPPVDA
ncbi:hypothetical protein C0992_009496 [Termitomyces sp. T32_za158]|nr:hypothetical protein C0992_009496 [Termitomyces sp. T32_za158]